MNTAFATGYSHDAVDGEAVVRVFVEKEILSAFGGRPILRRFAQCRIFDQFFEQLLALFIRASMSGRSAHAARRSRMKCSKTGSRWVSNIGSSVKLFLFKHLSPDFFKQSKVDKLVE